MSGDERERAFGRRLRRRWLNVFRRRDSILDAVSVEGRGPAWRAASIALPAIDRVHRVPWRPSRLPIANRWDRDARPARFEWEARTETARAIELRADEDVEAGDPRAPGIDASRDAALLLVEVGRWLVRTEIAFVVRRDAPAAAAREALARATEEPPGAGADDRTATAYAALVASRAGDDALRRAVGEAAAAAGGDVGAATDAWARLLAVLGWLRG